MRLDHKVSLIVAIPLVIGISIGHLFLYEFTKPRIDELESQLICNNGSKVVSTITRQYESMAQLIPLHPSPTDLTTAEMEYVSAHGQKEGMAVDCSKTIALVAGSGGVAIKKQISSFLLKDARIECLGKEILIGELKTIYDRLGMGERAMLLVSDKSVNEYLRVFNIGSGNDVLLRIVYPWSSEPEFKYIFGKGLLLLTLIITSTLCIVVLLTYRQIFLPLSRIRRDMKTAAEQNADSIDSKSYPSDIQPVVQTYNEVLQNMVAHHRQLEVMMETLDKKVHERTERLHRLNQMLVEAQEEERARMAMELHDGALTELSGNRYVLEAIGKMLEGTEDHALFVKVQNRLSQIYRNLRGLYEDIRPPLIDDLGLTGVIEVYIAEFMKRQQMQVKLSLNVDRRVVPSLEVSIACFRMIQEALANIAKHSGASEVQLTVRYIQQNQNLHVIIEDNGKGFDPENENGRRSGINHIRERAHLLGGTSRLMSNSSGTTIFWAVPCWKEKP